MQKKITKYIFLFMILQLPSVASANPGDSSLYGSFELNIGGRPVAPYPAMDNYNAELTESGAGQEYTVQVSRHHIIPFNVLRAFYNRLVTENSLRNASGFLNVYSNNLRFYAGSNGIDCNGGVGIDLFNAGNLAQAQGLGTARGNGDTFALGFDTFEQFYTWLPGNLFIGPTNRSDDPGEGFESDAHIVVGAENFDILSRVYNNMLAYNNDDDSVLNSIIADLTKIAARKRIYQLNPNDWIFENGLYHLKSGKNISLDTQESSTIDIEVCPDSKPNFLKLINAPVFIGSE